MHYYKSQELADIYNVSRRTVTNWVEQTQKGKLNLELVEKGGVFYVVKSEPNQARLNDMVKERRKYLNTRSLKQVQPLPEFYETYSSLQIHDMIHSLNVYRELPLQYSYFGEGAKIWDKWRKESTYSFDSERLLKANMSYLEMLLEKYKHVNVIDVGVGNGMTVRDLLASLKAAGKLKRYVGIDISSDMLEIASKNIHEWFNGEVQCETYIKDVTYESFGEIVAEPFNPRTQKQDTINIVLLLGGSLSNFREPSEVLRTIGHSMGRDDILITGFRLASPEVKNQLNFIARYQEQAKLVLDKLGIDESYYDVEIGFDDEEQIRYGRIRMNRTLKIEFDLPKGKWYVDLAKDTTILTYRANFNDMFTMPKEAFYKNGFLTLLQARREDHQGVIVFADLKK